MSTAILTGIGKDKLTFSYATSGSHGNSLLLLHGLASNQRIWELIAPQLSKHNKLVTIDQRGHGKSDKPDVGYDFKTIAKDAIDIIKQLDLQNPIILGHSWGGNVAVEIASHYPEHIKGICLVDGGLIEISKIPNNTLAKSLIDMAPPVWDGVQKNDIVCRLNSRDWGEQDETSQNANLTDIALSNFIISESGEVKSRLSRNNHIQIIKELWGHKPSQLFDKIKCPTLILNARNNNSESHPHHAVRMALISEALTKISKSKSIWLENSIHDVPLQKPELITTILNRHIQKGFFENH